MPINFVAYCAAEVGVPSGSIRRIATGAPRMYKKFILPKRGGRGFRVVAQPAREVKALQRALVKFVTARCPVHHCSTAYVQGASIAKNARIHSGARYLLKLDFEDFFGSVSQGDIRQFLESAFAHNASEVELHLMSRVATWRGANGSLALCIGAPSSPFFSNALLFSFDEAVYQKCLASNIRYTRYSDDLTFSGDSREELDEVEVFVRNYLAEMRSPSLRINERKRVFIGRASTMRVTGVYLSTQGGVTVGRARKRGIRAGVDHFLRQGLNEEKVARLMGEISFAQDVEPGFIAQLYQWYGARVSVLVPKKFRLE